MLLPRHHEQTGACRPSDLGRQASTTRRTGPRALAVAAMAAALLAPGVAPVSAQPTQTAVAGEGTDQEGVHRALAFSVIEEVISAAESRKGKPYVWGGSGPDSFDCSGLVQWSFRQAGVTLPRVAQDQARFGTRIPYSSAQRGDLVYWANRGGYIYHVGLYLGEGRMIDAPGTGDRVRERDVMSYNLAGAVRL